MPQERIQPSRPLVLVHGYSDRGESFLKWANVLKQRGYANAPVEIVTYKSLTNEVTIKDLAEGFDRALTRKGITGEFDAIVHSTGMLVIRAWLTANRGDRARVKRLRHLIGLAPATWGSPLAHRGRGFLGSIFKGSKARDSENAPDFLEAGDLILDGLELASQFTWDLAHVDLFDEKEEVFYGKESDTPYPFIFCGNEPYKGFLREKLVNEPGTDGTVRFAGVSLDSRKFVVDLTKGDDDAKRLTTPRPTNVDAPVIFVKGKNHGTILSEPDPELVDFVIRALRVAKHEEFLKWRKEAGEWSRPHTPETKFQHFVIHMADERGDSIPDYHVQLFRVAGKDATDLPFDLDLHAYERDKSYRSFHVDVDKLKNTPGDLWMSITLSSGTFLVAYRGLSNPGFPDATERAEVGEDFEDNDAQRAADAKPTEIYLNLEEHLNESAGIGLFHPFTTTLVEIRVDREPLPFGKALARLCRWVDAAEA